MTLIGNCDCCDARDVTLTRTGDGGRLLACLKCTESDDIDQLNSEIQRLSKQAETGKQWAYICALEDLMTAQFAGGV